MPDHGIDIKFPVFDNCTVLTRVLFLDDINNQHIFNYGRCRDFSPLESSIEEKEKMALFLVSSININCHGELRCPLVVRVPFILGTDLTESSTFTQSSPKYFSKPITCQARPNQVSYPARTDHFLFHLCPHTLSTHPPDCVEGFEGVIKEVDSLPDLAWKRRGFSCPLVHTEFGAALPPACWALPVPYQMVWGPDCHFTAYDWQ